MPLSVAEFVHRWKLNSQSERAGAHSHFRDLCEMLVVCDLKTFQVHTNFVIVLGMSTGAQPAVLTVVKG